MRKCTTGVLWKDSVAGYRLNAIERTYNLENALEQGTYKPKPVVHFRITSPKPREIASVAFRDRVYQRSLNDNAIYPQMVNSFILGNCACQKGKGTDYARRLLEKQLHEYYRKFGRNGYVAQFDIHGYYPNMCHQITEEKFKSKLNEDNYEKVIKILHEQYDGDKGYMPGSQLIQIAGVSLLDNFDHFCKEQLHAHFYLRYMDDFMIISNNKEYLKYCFQKIESLLDELGFELNRKKSKIYPLTDGINFLGFTYKFAETGKVLKLIRSENVKQQRLKLCRLVNKSKKGLIPKEKVDESYESWKAHARYGNSYNLLKRMDKYYESLW